MTTPLFLCVLSTEAVDQLSDAKVTVLTTDLNVVQPVSSGPLRVEDAQQPLEGRGVLGLADHLGALNGVDLQEKGKGRVAGGMDDDGAETSPGSIYLICTSLGVQQQATAIRLFWGTYSSPEPIISTLPLTP